jgi:hypothetical protein
MTKTFTTFTSRKDASMIGFRADDNDALLAEICTNSATGNVRAGFQCVLVPAHAADAVKAHLVKQGWEV